MDIQYPVTIVKNTARHDYNNIVDMNRRDYLWAQNTERFELAIFKYSSGMYFESYYIKYYKNIIINVERFDSQLQLMKIGLFNK